MNRKYRHELKFFCGETELQLIENKIKHVCMKDPHAGADGVYCIRSMYFDDYRNQCLQENEAGTDNRSKYRIRIYDCSDKVIKLERKGSLRDRKYKDSCSITKRQCEQILQGYPIDDIMPEQELLQEFLVDQRMKLLKPCVIVEYVRTPYVYPVGNVRITFDRYITSSAGREFFEKNIVGRGVLPEHMHILEVKYDEVFPATLLELLNGTCSLRRTSFSKYALCREYYVT